MTGPAFFALLVSATQATPSASQEQATPSPSQELVFHNARMALREHRQQDVLRLWLLRNALRLRGEEPVHDGDFRSVVWAALGETGFCPDGFPEDDDGAALWPIATHNWLLKNLAKPAPSQPPPWGSFPGGMQQRFVSLNDVLSLEEMKTVRFFRAGCWTPYRLLPRMPTLQWIDMEDRLSVGLMMRDLLERAANEIDPDDVEGLALLQTRRFDLDAALTRLASSRARAAATITDQLLASAGISPGGLLQMKAQRLGEFSRSSASELWQRAFAWSAAEWLSLSSQRRLALFADADKGLGDDGGRRRVILDLIDALLEQNAGPELTGWLGFAGVDGDGRGALIQEIVGGVRGEGLLGLEPATGFRERSVVALHRGVAFLRAGDTLQALRSFAFALGHAHESRDADGVHSLSQRWLAFVLSQYQTTEEVLAILDRFVPAADHNAVVEVLLWRAAFHGDLASFDRVVRSLGTAGHLKRTAQNLRPLAEGDPGRLWNTVEHELVDAAAIYRFTERLTDQLGLEPLDVRAHHRETLALGLMVLEGLQARSALSLQKKTRKLAQRIQALRDDIGAYDDSLRGRVEAGAVDREAYAGSVRLAPADPLPWPFAVPQVTPPNPFAPIALTPVEWRGGDGRLRYGWSLHE